MSESENNLDGFFRRRAQQTNVEFNEDDWLHLEARLNKEMPLKPAFWFWLRKYWFVPVLLSLIPALWFVIPDTTSNNAGIIINPIELSPGNQVGSQFQDEVNSGFKTPAASEVNEKVGNSASPDSDKQILQTDLNNVVDLNEQTEKASVQVNTIETKLPASHNLSNLDSEKVIFGINDKGYVVLGNGDEVPRLSGTSYLHFLSPITPNIDFLLDTPESLSLLDIETSFNKRFHGYFTLGIGYGPDFSTVGLDNFIAPGARWKLDLGYALSPRFQLMTGVVLVNNKYKASGDEYHAPKGYWQYDAGADEAYGECKMIDIPLNLRFNVITVGRHKAFVSSGLSTYIITKEDYYFDYYEDYPGSPDYWGTDNASVYPFSIINVSMGYEYILKGRGSIQVEPFIKLPINGVGWGNVDLNTLGIYFSYQYRIWP